MVLVIGCLVAGCGVWTIGPAAGWEVAISETFDDFPSWLEGTGNVVESGRLIHENSDSAIGFPMDVGSYFLEFDVEYLELGTAPTLDAIGIWFGSSQSGDRFYRLFIYQAFTNGHYEWTARLWFHPGDGSSPASISLGEAPCHSFVVSQANHIAVQVVADLIKLWVNGDAILNVQSQYGESVGGLTIGLFQGSTSDPLNSIAVDNLELWLPSVD
jgi:hypothetical protein